MTLCSRDKAFLADIAETNWMQHYVAVEAFVGAGRAPSVIADLECPLI